MKEIEEIVIKKISAYRTSLENMHLLETVHSYIENNKDKFIDRTYNCNVQTSQKVIKNILYDVGEFNYLTTNLENMIKGFLHQTLGKHAPFIIFESWINIYGKNGYQEPHTHVPPGEGGVIGVGCLYLTDNNSEIQFIVYPEVVQLLDGTLVMKNRKEALDYALDTGEYVELPTQSSASWFAKNYKKYWDKMGYEH